MAAELEAVFARLASRRWSSATPRSDFVATCVGWRWRPAATHRSPSDAERRSMPARRLMPTDRRHTVIEENEFLMSPIHQSIRSRRVIRVLACVAAPFDPGEVHEVAAVDVVVDGAGATLEELSATTFASGGASAGSDERGCTPMNVAAAVWGRRSPDILAAHDACTASLVFTPALTAGLPWVSSHRLARRVWPGQHAYDLESLSKWRAWAGPYGPFSRLLVSGAAREAALSAGLLVELLRDPGLRDVGEAAFLDGLDRDGWSDQGDACISERDVLDAALVVSALASKPLRNAPWPFDDQREWAGVGVEDLKHFARFSDDDATAAAARAELRARLGP